MRALSRRNRPGYRPAPGAPPRPAPRAARRARSDSPRTGQGLPSTPAHPTRERERRTCGRRTRPRARPGRRRSPRVPRGERARARARHCRRPSFARIARLELSRGRSLSGVRLPSWREATQCACRTATQVRSAIRAKLSAREPGRAVPSCAMAGRSSQGPSERDPRSDRDLRRGRVRPGRRRAWCSSCVRARHAVAARQRTPTALPSACSFFAFVVRLAWALRVQSPLTAVYSDMGGYVDRAEWLIAGTIPSNRGALTFYP